MADVDALRLELERLRESVKVREEELSRVVGNSKAIFELNLVHEAAKIEKRFQEASATKDEEVRYLNAMVSAKDSSIVDLSKRIAEFELEKLAALRDQRQSGMLSAEILNQDLRQTRALMEKNRYASERAQQASDSKITTLLSQLEILQAQADRHLSQSCAGCEVAEAHGRAILSQVEAEAFLLIRDWQTSALRTKERSDQTLQLALRKICEGALGPLKNRNLNKSFNPPTINSIDHTVQYITNHYGYQLQQLELEFATGAEAHRRAAITNEATRLKCLRMGEQMAVFAHHVMERLKENDLSLARASEMQRRLGDKVSRQMDNKMPKQTIDAMAKVYEEEISALKATNLSITNMLAQSKANSEALLTKLEESRQQLERSSPRREARSATEPSRKVPSHNQLDTVNLLEEEEADEDVDNKPDALNATAADPFSQWAVGQTADVPAPSNNELREASEEISVLRKELETARSSIVDLKALVRRLRERPSSQTNLSPRSQPSEDNVHSLAAPLPIASTPTPLQREADTDTQMQLFSLRRERDAWKRKADAALAQASHAEEQRLASVHTYLQLVGRKEEEHAHSILAGEGGTTHVNYTPQTHPQPAKEDTSNSLMPGSNTQIGLDEAALAGVMREVKSRGEQRAERWLAEKAEELRSQEGQLNRLREELALKASSLARREEALKHEKTGLLLKKGGARPVGASNLLLGTGGSSVHEGPLRETYPTTRLQPILQLPAATAQTPKPHHPQRFVLSPMAGTMPSNVK